ncbi:hypothetical protein [Methylocystis sp. SB2]|uniref:hypothetical protein n=1 Tax=Methylocystis sp. (strain SB2) TaxID=743836 RepID=UPI000422AD60|nr:hypothetical protein [Methylocystis sp. SB2]ULO24689.1 hypothetical protein LNB28_04640 [Methylocystis sp. SB2]
MTNEIEINQIEAAVDQLDWAIRLLIDHRAYAPSITLAGAAEEILGKLVQPSAHKTLSRDLAMEFDISAKEISDDYLNKARNWLKHVAESPHEKLLIEDNEVVQIIVRALSNLSLLDHKLSREGKRFLVWLKENKPDQIGNWEVLSNVATNK